MSDFAFGVLWRVVVVSLVLSVGQLGWNAAHPQQRNGGTAAATCQRVKADQAWMSDVDGDGQAELVLSDGRALTVLEPVGDGSFFAERC